MQKLVGFRGLVVITVEPLSRIPGNLLRPQDLVIVSSRDSRSQQNGRPLQCCWLGPHKSSITPRFFSISPS